MLMTVMAPTPREKWTDERLDDLSTRVDVGFADTKAEMRVGFADTKAEMRTAFARVDGEIKGLRDEMNARLDRIDARFDALNRNLIWGLASVVIALIGSNAF
jgi:hypothetical protein